MPAPTLNRTSPIATHPVWVATIRSAATATIARAARRCTPHLRACDVPDIGVSGRCAPPASFGLLEVVLSFSHVLACPYTGRFLAERRGRDQGRGSGRRSIPEYGPPSSGARWLHGRCHGSNCDRHSAGNVDPSAPGARR